MEPSRMGSNFSMFMKRNAAEIFQKFVKPWIFRQWKNDRVSCLS